MRIKALEQTEIYNSAKLTDRVNAVWGVADYLTWLTAPCGWTGAKGGQV